MDNGQLTKAQEDLVLMEIAAQAARNAALRAAFFPQTSESWRSKFRRAARVICKLGTSAQEWRDVATANQAALEKVCADRAELSKALYFSLGERDALKETLRSTTADMNRYIEALEKLKAAEDTQRREGAKVGRPLPSGDVLAQVFWQGFESSRKPGSRVAYGELDLDTRRHQEEGIQYVLDALGPHLRPADETAETLRGRLRQVSVSLDEEKAGRLRAETKVDELEGRLAAERKAAELALSSQKQRYEDRLSDLRNNHLGQMTGFHAMLADVERKAWHGTLMVQALSLGMAQAEYERLTEECWKLMKKGVDGKVLTERGAIVSQLAVNPPAADASRGQATAEEEEEPARCLRCGFIMGTFKYCASPPPNALGEVRCVAKKTAADSADRNVCVPVEGGAA